MSCGECKWWGKWGPTMGTCYCPVDAKTSEWPLAVHIVRESIGESEGTDCPQFTPRQEEKLCPNES